MVMNNRIPGWKYYNHAAIPTVAPHEMPDLSPVNDGSIWNIEGKKPLLIRYTTDWDCKLDTDWWYLIREAPFDINSLSSNSRKHIKEAFRKVKVKKIDPKEYVDALYECYHQAYLGYKQADNEDPYESFKQRCEKSALLGLEFWAGFALDSGKLVGYLMVGPHEDWVEVYTSKFHPEYLKLRVSDALYAFVLDFYLNGQYKKYVSSGTRSINHVTNTQEYKEQHFGYRKCFCRLHVQYNPRYMLFFKVLFPFRGFISVLGRRVSLIHRIAAVLKMEEIARKSCSHDSQMSGCV